MNPDIEKILLAQAAKEAEQGPRLSDAIAVGAGGGAAMGALVGSVPYGLSEMFRTGNKSIGQRLTPGTRMAGGLVGAILGGGLGAAMQREAVSEASGAGALLARIQSQGGINPGDQAELEQALRNAYSQQGILG